MKNLSPKLKHLINISSITKSHSYKIIIIITYFRLFQKPI